ncbi:MAG: TIGR02444 family protein, partial [Alphaproteobacteria bacterium]
MGHKEQGWDWIVGFYSKPAVKSACLVFQDRHGIDVTFLLFLCWLDREKLQLSEHYLTVLGGFSVARKKIRFIRKLRRLVSTFSFAGNLKKRLLAKELNLEKEFFYGLCGHQMEKAENTVLAKNYITYKGAIP